MDQLLRELYEAMWNSADSDIHWELETKNGDKYILSLKKIGEDNAHN